MSNYCVIGTGMAGYGAAHRLQAAGIRPAIFDQRAYFGGHTASHYYENGNYTFDEGPHISFTKDERVKQILASSIDQQHQCINAKVNNYWRGHWIKHPAQVNLHGLPTDLIVDIIRDFVEAQRTTAPVISNYEQWLRASFGNTFAETFPMQYTIKYHTTEAKNMSTDWIGPRLYQAKLTELLRGALAPAAPDVHYITDFRYPSRGGFVSYLRRFMESADVRLDHAVSSINPRSKSVRFQNGATIEYKGLVSSMPLTELIPTIEGTPKDVLEAAARLACTELVVVNLAINRPNAFDAHWTYFYDQDVFFTRLSTPNLQSPNNVPAGCSSFQAECYFSDKYRPLDRKPDDCIEPVIRDLRRCGILRVDDKIVFQSTLHTRYAQVIFDLERSAAVATVHGYLNDLGIAYCGRYGDWAYIWTDESFLSGERAAEKILAH